MFGDPRRFAIEFEPENVASSAQWGALRIWAGDSSIGDFREVDAIGHMEWFFSDFLHDLKPDSSVDTLDARAAMEKLYTALCRGDGSLSEALANEKRYRRFVLAPNGMRSFDGEFVVVLGREGDGKRVIRRTPLGDVNTIDLDNGELERVGSDFVRWLREKFEVARVRKETDSSRPDRQ